MPANQQNNPSFFNFSNVNLFTNVTGTPTYADKVKTVGETQATPSQISSTWDDNSPLPAPTSGGTGAGTTDNAVTSVNADDNPTPTEIATQQTINTSTAALQKLIPTQPNQLDQYASYTYALSWYLLTPQQFNDMTASASQKPNTATWQLLMQSGGAPTAGRNPAFSLDYYMDDLEITTKCPGSGTNKPHSATDIRFKVVEPNGITLLQSLFNAVSSTYKNAQQATNNTTNLGPSTATTATTAQGATTATQPTTNQTPNYINAQYCMVIEFYGYDAGGNLIAPAKGAFSTNGGYGQNAVIVKYFPFKVTNIKFQIANKAIEYSIEAKAIGQSYAFSTDRGTVPYPFTLTGQTVDQLLNGSVITGTETAPTDNGRPTTPTPPTPPITVADLPMQQQAAIAAGTDPNAVNDQGMAFGGGGLSG